MAQIRTVDDNRPYMPWVAPEDRIFVSGRMFAIEYDGKCIVDMLTEKEHMTLSEARNLIVNEGGYVDEDGTVHRGSAQYQVHAPSFEGEWIDLEAKTRTPKANNVRLPFGAMIGKAFLGRSIVDAFLSEEAKEWSTECEEHKERELTMKGLCLAMAKYNYYVGKDGKIRFIFGRKPSKDEDKIGAYEKVTR